MEPLELPDPLSQPELPVARETKSPFMKTLGTLVIFLVLFGVGVGGSLLLRSFLTPQDRSTEQSFLESLPTPVFEQEDEFLDSFAGWNIYQVINGTTREPIEGISYKLPESVLSPICDGLACSSQGTYLPGGTRFTIAPRGKGQQLSDFRGAEISDNFGVPFTTKTTKIPGSQLRATEFTGTFTGTTLGGYSFTAMRGVMIEINGELSLEINHFTPRGVDSDFATDDVLFDEILQTFTVTSIPIPSLSPINATESSPLQ
ncbi:MAG: hypothetical protein Q7S76_01815 [bacterium]|nr:hypothetical protein [bacterium]